MSTILITDRWGDVHPNLLDLMYGETTFFASVDGQFGLLVEEEWITPGYDSPEYVKSAWGRHLEYSTVDDYANTLVTKLTKRFPEVNFHYVDEGRITIYAFIPIAMATYELAEQVHKAMITETVR